MAIVTQAGNQVVTQGGNALTPKVAPVTTVPLELLRVRVGLSNTDNSRDLEIETAWQMTLLWLENYLDRYLVPGTYTENFVHKTGETISLKGYPVLSIDQINSAQLSATSQHDRYHIDRRSGLMQYDGHLAEHDLEVTYTMADPLVGPIMLAALMLFDTAWSGFTSAGSSVGGGAVKAISSDGARVEFDVGGGGSSATGIDGDTGMPAAIIGILAPYRREHC